MRRVFAALAVLLLAPVTVGGCDSQAGHGIIAGRFVRVGGPPPGSPVPLPGQIVATGGGGSRYTTTAGSNGRYSLSLPPGTYRLTGYSPQVHAGSSEVKCSAEHAVRVSAHGRTAGIEVICSIS